MGFARQGMSLARYLTAHGARVTVSDTRAELPDLAEFRAMGINFELGGHPLSLLDGCNQLFLSGGVPNDTPIVLDAGRRGIRIANDAELFLERCPTRMVVGITGSAGKTTTTVLTQLMLAGSSLSGRVWMGGNIGNPLIEVVEQIAPDDVVVIELSSFQLEWMHTSPHIACVTNITPNHLDRHADMAAYIAAKRNILRYQTGQDLAVLNADDPITVRELTTNAGVARFSLRAEPDGSGAWLADSGELRLRTSTLKAPSMSDMDGVICSRGDLKLMGDHNVANVLAASVLAALAGASLDSIRDVATTFTGVAHRLELVREINTVRWFNDSIATAPERLMAGLRVFKVPVVLLVGGRDKHLPWDEAITLMARQCRHVIFFGELGPMVARQFAIKNPRWSLVPGLTDAIIRATEVARENDVVLLSPGGTGFDEFKDFAERGDYFKTMVRDL